MTLDEWEQLDPSSRASIAPSIARAVGRLAAQDFLRLGYFSAEAVWVGDRYGDIYLTVMIPPSIYESLAPGWERGGFDSRFRGFEFHILPLRQLWGWEDDEYYVRKNLA